MLNPNIKEFVQSKGYAFEPQVDGQYHEFVEDNRKGWFIGSEVTFKEKNIITFSFGEWKTNEKHTYKSFAEEDADTRQEADKILLEHERKIREAREKKHLETAKHAQDEWDKILTMAGESPYLKKKKITELFGAKTRVNDWNAIDLIIPMRDIDNKLWGYQKIQPEGEKFFLPGQKSRGVFHTIGQIEPDKLIYICEGFATGATIHMATGRPVICTFSANNLLPVGIDIRRKFPHASLTYCADNDQFTKKQDGTHTNPGKEFSEEAAHETFGAVAIPEFKVITKKPTDYNDLYLLEGLDEVVHQLKLVKERRPPAIFPIGYLGDKYYISSSDSPQISRLSDFSETDLLKLLPLKFWQEKYGEMSRQGKIVINWTSAKSDLMELCRARGPFEISKVRGRGVWRDGGKIVVHLGDRLFYDESEHHIQSLTDSHYYYDFLPPIESLAPNALENSEAQKLVDIIAKLAFKMPEHRMAFTGWLVTAPLAGLLDWRPHLWITGQAGSGKSTILDKICSPLFSALPYFKSSKTTEAGLRQKIRHDAIPIIVDEFETKKYGQKSMQELLELARVASSHGTVVRGTSAGRALEYTARFSALFSSINIAMLNEADSTRITPIEMDPVKNEPWEGLRVEIENVITEDYSRRFFTHCIKRAHVILESQKIIQEVLALTMGQRYGQQYGTFLSGYWALTHSTVITVNEAKELSKEWLASEHTQATIEDKTIDHDDCLTWLLSSKVRTAEGENSISELIVGTKNEPDTQYANSKPERELLKHGLWVKYEDNKPYLFVSSKHPELEKIFGNTPWHNWQNALLRVKDSKRFQLDIENWPRRRGILIYLNGHISHSKTAQPNQF